MNQLLQHYYRCRQVPLEQFWQAFDSEVKTGRKNPFIEWLPTFYDELLLLTNTEVF
jgi:hypothetical protein